MLPKLSKNITFVDIETTGMSAMGDRIMEIGILRVEDNKLKKTYKQLINPENYISPFISQMTGITEHDIDKAPTFYQVKDEIFELLKDSVFVAHNVRFDYGFIRQEFARLGMKLNLPHFCTVRLFRALVPGRQRYNLDELISYYHIPCKNRHRAFDDAHVLWKFYQISKKTTPKDKFQQAIEFASQRPTLPDAIDPSIIDTLPETPGVYIFRNADNAPLYIGKSTNIRSRVLSHFSADYTSIVEMKIKNQIRDIETIPTAGELGALLLESELIKTQQPLYNRMLRFRQKITILRQTVTPENYFSVTCEKVEHISPDEIDTLVGVFKNEKQGKTILTDLAREHSLCPKLLSLEKGKGPCFSSHLHLCKGACTGKELPARYNLRFTEAFSHFRFKRWPFSGAVIVKEKNLEGKEEGYILNQWCLIGKASWDETGAIKQQKYEYTFDVDVYKILVRQLLLKKQPYSIMPLQSGAHSESLHESSQSWDF